MSTYRVDGRVGVITSPGIWRVLDDTGRVVGYGTEAEDAERIARALSALDAMDEHYAGEAAAQAASDDDVRRADQARGEG